MLLFVLVALGTTSSSALPLVVPRVQGIDWWNSLPQGERSGNAQMTTEAETAMVNKIAKVTMRKLVFFPPWL